VCGAGEGRPAGEEDVRGRMATGDGLAGCFACVASPGGIVCATRVVSLACRGGTYASRRFWPLRADDAGGTWGAFGSP
jgi:hypothetical protein